MQQDDMYGPERKGSSARGLRQAGFSYLGMGAAFLAIAVFAGQDAFTGVGFAFLGLGTVFLANARRRR